MIPDPLRDWFSDKTKQARLEEILLDPVMKEAMALLQFVKLPVGDHGILPSAEEIGASALEHHRNRGFFAYPRELWNLTEKPAEPQKMPEPYSDSHVLDYALKQGFFDKPQPAATTQS